FQEIGVRVIGYFGKRFSSRNCRSGNMTSGKAKHPNSVISGRFDVPSLRNNFDFGVER
ncbi:16124_t:CDS:2, partial [Funneliformis geosporum]